MTYPIGLCLGVIISIIILILLAVYLCYVVFDMFKIYGFKFQIYDKNTVDIPIHAENIMQRTYNTVYPFYTFYTIKYKSVYQKMIETLQRSKNTLDVRSVVLDQQELQSCWDKYKKNFYDYRWRGCAIKLHMICNVLESNMGKYIVFGDCDLYFIRPISGLLDYYVHQKYDVVATESCISSFSNYCITMGSNVGVMLIHCTPSTLEFYKHLAYEVEKRNQWDEGAFKKYSETSGLKHGVFPTKYVSTQFTYDAHHTLVVKILGGYFNWNKNSVQKKIEQDIANKRLV